MEYFLDIIKAIVFGIVEGITEWLPVSSTGHMIVLEQFFSLTSTQGKAFFDFFLVVIQLGAILAVVVTFFKKLWPFSSKLSPQKKKNIWLTWAKILLASIPAGVVGIIFNDYLDEYLYNYLTVSITLIVYGVAFIAVELLLVRKTYLIKQRYHLNTTTTTTTTTEEETDIKYPLFNIHSIKHITFQYAFIIGLAQCLALIPGTSRSGVTILAALLLSIDRSTAAQFSFYLSIPAMFGGSLIKAVLYGRKIAIGEAAMITWFQVILIIIAMAVAFGVSIIVIKYFMKLLKTRTFLGFGIYRICLGIVLLIILYTVNQGNLKAGVSEEISSLVGVISSNNLLNNIYNIKGCFLRG